MVLRCPPSVLLISRQPIGIVYNLSPLSHSAPNPHPGIHKPVPIIPRLHPNKQPERISLRIYPIRLHRIHQRLQHLRRAGPPPIRLDTNIRRLVIVRLKQIIRLNPRGTIRGHELRVLTAWLDGSPAPFGCPAAAGEADPVPLTPFAGTDGNLGVEVDGDAQVVRGFWGWDLEIFVLGKEGSGCEFHCRSRRVEDAERKRDLLLYLAILLNRILGFMLRAEALETTGGDRWKLAYRQLDSQRCLHQKSDRK